MDPFQKLAIARHRSALMTGEWALLRTYQGWSCIPRSPLDPRRVANDAYTWVPEDVPYRKLEVQGTTWVPELTKYRA